MSGYGYQRPPITLMDQTLTLDPEIAATIAEIEAQMAAREWLERLQNPNWVLHVQLLEEMTAQTF